MTFTRFCLLLTDKQTSDDYSATSCSGVWSKESIPGGSQPYIKGTFCIVVQFEHKVMFFFLVSVDKNSKGKVALLIYEWADFKNLGAVDSDTGEVIYKCVCVCLWFSNSTISVFIFVILRQLRKSYVNLQNQVNLLLQFPLEKPTQPVF